MDIKKEAVILSSSFAVYFIVIGVVVAIFLIINILNKMHSHEVSTDSSVEIEPEWLISAVRIELKAAEGYSETAYRDGRQYAICWGHAKGIEQGETLSKSQCEVRLTMDIDNAIEDARVSVKRFDRLPVDVKWSLIEMAFVLGRTGLQRFPKMIAAINEDDFYQAANEVVNSVWYTRNPARVERIAARIRDESINRTEFIEAQQERAN